MRRVCVNLLLVSVLVAGCGGEKDTTCTVEDHDDGTATISCPDGTSTTVGGDQDTSCTIEDNGDGTSTITCDDGTTVVVGGGEDKSCTIEDNGDGTSTITCDDGTTVVVGGDDQSCTVVDNGDGTATIDCDDGTTVTVGEDDSCTIADNGNGTSTITCDDGTTVTVGGDSSCSITHHDDGTATIICDDGTNVTVSSRQIVFFESAVQTGGNLGDRVTTAATCQAARGELACANGVQALIAYTGGDDLASMPANHGVPTDVPIVSPTGIRVADNWADLFDGDGITTSLFDAEVRSTSTVFYAGSNTNGTTSSSNCDDWTIGDGTAEFDAGFPLQDQANWIRAPAGPYGCGFDTRLVCVCY